jgi:septal ring factor EnvC (AmiA/AmiB activator)
MRRRIALSLAPALLSGSGCAIVDRLDQVNQQLATTNSQLATANAQLAGANQRLDEANRRIDVLDQAVMRFPGLRPEPTPTNPNPANPAAPPVAPR